MVVLKKCWQQTKLSIYYIQHVLVYNHNSDYLLIVFECREKYENIKFTLWKFIGKKNSSKTKSDFHHRGSHK